MTTEEKKLLWEKCLDTVFPNRWEFKPVNDGFMFLVIHFPEVIIKNDLELEHTIKDLFVKLGFYNSYDIHAIPIGFRTTFSVKELLLNYAHSHIGNLACNNRFIDGNNFCLGSSELEPQLRALNNGSTSLLTEENIILFLFNLETYVAWESLEGGPYKKIEQLSDWYLLSKNLGKNLGKKYILKDGDINKFYKAALPYLKGLTPVLTGSADNIMFKFLENQLTDCFKEINTIPCLNNTGYLVPTSTDDLKSLINHNIVSGTYGQPFLFRDTIYPFVVYDIDTMSFNDMDIGMPNLLKTKLLTKINYEYNNSAKKYFASQKN